MKLNKIKRICKEEKAVFIMEQKDSAGGIYQWIGDGKALFTAEGLPAVCPQELLAVFDVPERCIDFVAWKLAKKYINKGLDTVEKIAPVYCGESWGGYVKDIWGGLIGG